MSRKFELLVTACAGIVVLWLDWLMHIHGIGEWYRLMSRVLIAQWDARITVVASQILMIAYIVTSLRIEPINPSHPSLSNPHIQKNEPPKPNESAPNTPIEFPSSAKRPTGPTSPTLIRRNTWSRPIWPWVNSIMWFGRGFSWLRRRLCFCFVRIRFLRMVSLFICGHWDLLFELVGMFYGFQISPLLSISFGL